MFQVSITEIDTNIFWLKFHETDVEHKTEVRCQQRNFRSTWIQFFRKSESRFSERRSFQDKRFWIRFLEISWSQLRRDPFPIRDLELKAKLRVGWVPRPIPISFESKQFRRPIRWVSRRGGSEDGSSKTSFLCPANPCSSEDCNSQCLFIIYFIIILV